MIISYSSNRLKKILSDPRLIKKYYSNNYKKINNRLSEMQAVNNLSEIPECPPPRRHKLYGNYKDCWGIDCSKNYRIIIRPVGKFDINNLSSICEIEIIDLEDYH